MAKFRRRIRMEKETARKKEYLKHYKKAGKHHAFSYAQWLEKGKTPAYFKGMGGKSTETQLREARVSPARLKRKR